MKKFLPLFVLFTAPLVSFAILENTQQFITVVGRVIGQFIIYAAALALLTFFWGLVRFIWRAADPKAKAEGKAIMVWGIIALFVMVSVWGIVAFLQREFGLPVNVPTTSITGGTTGGNPSGGTPSLGACLDKDGNYMPGCS